MEFKDSLNALIQNPVIANMKSGNTTEAMTVCMEWAYNQSASGEIPPPFVNAMQLADEYRMQYSSLTEAANNLIKNELPKISGIGFLTSFGGIASLPVNVASVLLMQIRLIQAIACLAGRDLEDDEVKKLIGVSLLGAQISGTVKKQMLEGGVEKVLILVAKKLAPKMLGTRGLLKCVPIISGMVGTSIDTLTTYGILKVAQEQFLGEAIKQEAFVIMHEQRIKLLINMAHVDNNLVEEEITLIKQMIDESDFSEDKKQKLYDAISDRTPSKIDFTPFKEEKIYAINVLSGLVAVMNADGKLHHTEKLYLMEIAKEINISKDELDVIIDSCNS